MSDEIDKPKAKLETARCKSEQLQSENRRLKAILEAFAVKPAAALQKSPKRLPSERAPKRTGESNRTLRTSARQSVKAVRRSFSPNASRI